jgi:hypothetical protein
MTQLATPNGRRKTLSQKEAESDPIASFTEEGADNKCATGGRKPAVGVSNMAPGSSSEIGSSWRGEKISFQGSH